METNRSFTLIADSGSTKTEWAILVNHETSYRCFESQGINPFVQTEETIKSILKEELCPAFAASEQPERIFFYGAGCTPEKAPIIKRCLQQFFPKAHIDVQSDLLGATRALLGNNPGIAAILGTGSNSCLYDGKEIIKQTPSMGFILGDEGSGASLGKALVADVAKGIIDPKICEMFYAETGLTIPDILERVYKKPLPNRFLAGLVPFLARHKAEKAIQHLIISNFRTFFKRNITPYNRTDLGVYFIGGLAKGFEVELRKAAHEEGFSVKDIFERPMPGLISYHQE